MKFHGFDITIVDIESDPSFGKDRKLVYFSVDGYPEPTLTKDYNEPFFEYVYNPTNINDSFFTDFPDEFTGIECPENSMNCVDRDFYKLVKQYELKKSLTPQTLQTFNDLIDEL